MTVNTFAASDTARLADAFGMSEVLPSPARVVVSVLVVLALVVGVLLLLMGRGGGRAPVRPGEIRVLTQTSLGRRGALVLVEVEGRRVLVGAAQGHLTALSEWETLPEEGEDAVQLDAAVRPGFDGVMQRVVTKLRLLEGAS